jgi:hypothetical protein
MQKEGRRQSYALSLNGYSADTPTPEMDVSDSPSSGSTGGNRDVFAASAELSSKEVKTALRGTDDTKSSQEQRKNQSIACITPILTSTWHVQ